MILNWILTVIFAVSAAIFYRMGGSGNHSRQWRRTGLPILAAGLCSIWGLGHWSLVLCVGIMYGAITTYWDFINYWFGVNDPESEYFWNWFLHGFFVSAAFFPLVIALDLWSGFWIRNLITGLAVMAWSEIQGDAVIEELGRGFIIMITIPLLVLV